MPKGDTPAHPLREAGFIPDDGRWLARGDVCLWWDAERMDWVLSLQLDSGRQVETRLRWQDLQMPAQHPDGG